MSTQVINTYGNTNFTVEITPKQSITVTRSGHPSNSFVIGDEAEYDSYNLHYTGTIVSITEKTVTIDPGYNERKRRLKISEFAWRNYDFNSAQIAAKNSDTMMYI